jgi:cytochrome c oxidase assembly factor CtaG
VPSLTSAAAWPIEPPFAVIVLAALLYVLGGRRRVSARRSREQRWRTPVFALALLSLVAALDSPLDALADTSFAAHMAQHVLLLAVAPPLLVLAAPWTRLWQPLPLRFRRAVARAVVVSPRAQPLRTAAHTLARPLVAWTLFDVNMVVWHVPALYDFTLRSEGVHQTEHMLFFATGLLFWGAVVDSPPFRAALDWLWRIAYLVGAILVGWVLSLVLAFAPSPLYPAYAHLAHRPGGLTALADQQLAGGIMLVPGSLSLSIAVFVFFYRWLAPDRREEHPWTSSPRPIS